MYDDQDDAYAMERAYMQQYRAHARLQATEDRDTGYQHDPFPSFDVWERATPCDTEDDDAASDPA